MLEVMSCYKKIKKVNILSLAMIPILFLPKEVTKKSLV